MELPTYTSIWRIEKRLYKLYDFRLPMPLPVGQIAVFAGITVPYIILLRVFGLPFNHTLFWLYVVPPGVLTWLATRPVLESKRLPELMGSQLRYLGEPSVWCRMAPLTEKDDITVVGRVWRRAQPFSFDSHTPKARTLRGRLRSILASRRAAPVAESGPRLAAATTAQAPAAPAGAWARHAAAPEHAKRAQEASGSHHTTPVTEPVSRQPQRATWPAWPGHTHRLARSVAPPSHRVATPAEPGSRPPEPGSRPPELPGTPGPAEPAAHRGGPGPGTPGLAEPPAHRGGPGPGTPGLAEPPAHRGGPGPGTTERAAGPAEPAGPPASPPRAAPDIVVVPAQRPGAGADAVPPARPAPPVERALGGPGEHRATGWRSHVSIVPGGRGPGRPDAQKRAKARAVLPVEGPRLVVVLGCTVGAGQTVTTLLLADLLSTLRTEPVAALDLNPGPASLSELARVPAISVSDVLAGRVPASTGTRRGQSGRTIRGRGRGDSSGSRGRLDVISDDLATDGGPARTVQQGRLLDILASRYAITLADPGASAVARLLAVADRLVLVAPASPDAARALGMTLEWLGAHGHNVLSEHAITVINGVSQRSSPHADEAVAVVSGRCAAIVRIPWDDHLAEPETERGIRDSLAMPGASRLRQMRPAVQQAYTALAGVLVRELASGPQERRAAP